MDGKLTALAATAERAARAAGAELLRLQGGPLGVTLKDARVDVTSTADLSAQRAVTDVIGAEYPDHTVIGEEGDGERRAPGSGPVWYVDPLDGTRNYLNGVPYFGTSVAVTLDGKVLAGAVYDPSRDELFTATLGHGVTCNGTPLRVSTVPSAAEALVVTQAQSADPAVIAEFLELMGLLMNTTAGVRFPGAPALVLAHIAAGRYTAYVERAMDPWDTAAGRLLVEEAGGRFTDFAGRPVGLGCVDVVASNASVHDELVAALGEGIAQP
ncbi:MAG: inositol monophosphatase [Pseudonocardiaceae bacterium]|nr:inositol monophosphatase [Pseudonocardiaceae bacterium]